jgi:hypothetical protein
MEDRQPLPDYWQLEFPVSPKGSASKTDVMLVQALLVTYALSDIPGSNDKLEALRILNSQPGRFDDGIYGSRTRALLKIFENHYHSPVKDGIVRPSSIDDILSNPHVDSRRIGKLHWLNEIWDLSMSGGGMGSTKQERARIVLNPILFSRLYPEPIQ